MPTRSRETEAARAIVQSIGDAVVTTGVDCMVTYINPVAERLTGWTLDDARGQSLEALLPLFSEATRQPIPNTAVRCLAEDRSIDLEDGVVLVRRDGTEVPVGDSAAPIRNVAGEVIGVVLVIQDESEKRRVGHQLTFEATHDALTGLVNQREFERRLAHLFVTPGTVVAEHFVICLDLDRFKVINDTCGHHAGDTLLRKLAALFASSLRRGDTLARIGGDEFAILLENCPLIEAERIAENLRAAVSQYRFLWGESAFAVSVSVGLLATNGQGESVMHVLSAADAACYAAKEAGGNRVQVAVREVRPRATVAPRLRARRVTQLARAADEGQFRLYAQPMVALQEEPSAPVRLEILLRMPDKDGRMEPAARFLPQAERFNLMPAIDRWVMRETIALLGLWHREFPRDVVPVCSVNLDASALADDHLMPVLEQQLVRYDVPSAALCFEVTETAVLADLRQAERFFSGLKALGCGTALDDFGSGVTAFTHLRKLPVDYLKIGGHLIQRIVEDPIRSNIIRAVDQIGRSLGMFTVAKHVGSGSAVEKLRELGIRYAQGHALTPPAPFTDNKGRVMMRELLQSA